MYNCTFIPSNIQIRLCLNQYPKVFNPSGHVNIIPDMFCAGPKAIADFPLFTGDALIPA